MTEKGECKLCNVDNIPCLYFKARYPIIFSISLKDVSRSDKVVSKDPEKYLKIKRKEDIFYIEIEASV